MTLVRIVKSWTWPDLLRQTPAGDGIWDECRFTLDPVERCDFLVALNHIPADLAVTVPPSRVWLFMQEPPERDYRWAERGFHHFSRIHTQDTRLRGPSIVHTHGSLPWHLDRTYEELLDADRPEKTRDLAWITSNLAVTAGHRRRLRFLRRLLAARVPFDLYGRGFRPIADKWDALAPSRYALAIEKMSCEHYWTEKLADCFLAWAMPIYYGATRLEDYFPAESFVRIDINDPDAPRRVVEIIRSDLAERNRAAIDEARRRVLEEHNLFPRLARLIAEERASNPGAAPQRLHLPRNPDLTRYYAKTPVLFRAWRRLARQVKPAR